MSVSLIGDGHYIIMMKGDKDMDLTNIFSNEGEKVKCNYDMTLFIENSNVTVLPDGNLECLLFGSFLVIHDGKEVQEKTLGLGTRVVVPIYSSSQWKKEGDHIVVDFIKDDYIIDNRFVPADITNVSDMFKAITTGHISKKIDYYKYYKILINNMENNEKLPVNNLLLEIMLGEIFVDENGKKCRRSGNTKGTPLSVHDMIQMAGAFNSMLHEDPGKSILINKGKTREEQMQESKLETYFRK